MGKYKVTWEALGGVEVEVEDAENRWDAVVKAAEKARIADKGPMQALFDAASVVKLDKKRTRNWRFLQD